VRYKAEAFAGRLLRILLLWLGTVPAEAIGELLLIEEVKGLSSTSAGN
jgi:hypothetical protein